MSESSWSSDEEWKTIAATCMVHDTQDNDMNETPGNKNSQDQILIQDKSAFRTYIYKDDTSSTDSNGSPNALKVTPSQKKKKKYRKKQKKQHLAQQKSSKASLVSSLTLVVVMII